MCESLFRDEDETLVQVLQKKESLKAELNRMKTLKQNRRPQVSSSATDKPAVSLVNDLMATASVSELEVYKNMRILDLYPLLVRRPVFIEHCKAQLEDVLSSMSMSKNFEQEQALHTIAEHFYTRNNEQLLMYVSGVGGTGKSHLINDTVRFFSQCGFSSFLLLGAPTGIAAVLINGWTVHALCYLAVKDTKSKDDELRAIWKDVRYLIIDEVSMLSARTLCEISERLCQAKSWDATAPKKPFGGVNIIFMGDFGQLKPIRKKSLYDGELVDALKHTKYTAEVHQDLRGVILWS